MNQAIIFNNDVHFNDKREAWCFSLQRNGELLFVFIPQKYFPKTQLLSEEILFDWENGVEEWLEENEPNDNQEVLFIPI